MSDATEIPLRGEPDGPSAQGADRAPRGAGAGAKPRQRRPPEAGPRPRARRSGSEEVRARALPTPVGAADTEAFADERLHFVQIMVAPLLHQRLEDVSYALQVSYPHLRHQKTILGALTWRFVRPEDPEAMRELGATLDAYLASDLSDLPAKTKVGAHLAFSLKHRLDGAALALRRTNRAASTKTLLSALIWANVDPERQGELVELLGAYYELARPRPTSLEHAPNAAAQPESGADGRGSAELAAVPA